MAALNNFTDVAGGDTDHLDADNEGSQVDKEVGSEKESSSCHSDEKLYGEITGGSNNRECGWILTQ